MDSARDKLLSPGRVIKDEEGRDECGSTDATLCEMEEGRGK